MLRQWETGELLELLMAYNLQRMRLLPPPVPPMTQAEIAVILSRLARTMPLRPLPPMTPTERDLIVTALLCELPPQSVRFMTPPQLVWLTSAEIALILAALARMTPPQPDRNATPLPQPKKEPVKPPPQPKKEPVTPPQLKKEPVTPPPQPVQTAPPKSETQLELERVQIRNENLKTMYLCLKIGIVLAVIAALILSQRPDLLSLLF